MWFIYYPIDLPGVRVALRAYHRPTWGPLALLPLNVRTYGDEHSLSPYLLRSYITASGESCGSINQRVGGTANEGAAY